ncbi:hypothetical protein BD626DRAFT_622186, partial [Schizophyllum amplum]
PGFEELPEGRVSCTACAQFGKSDLLRGYQATHIETEKHAECVRLLDARRLEEEARQKNLKELYTRREQPNPTYSPSPNIPRPSMFQAASAMPEAPVLQNDTPTAYIPDMSAVIPGCGMDIDEPPDIEAEYARYARIAEQLRAQALHEEEFVIPIEEDDTEPYMPDELRNLLGVGDDDSEETYHVDAHEAQKWRPYPDKITLLLDIIDNLPRLRMSTSQFRIVLWLLKECGVNNVPSYDKFREVQADVGKTCGTANTEEHVSALGNHFFTNNIAHSIALDFANPEVAKNLNFYPEEVEDGRISEVWQAKRWKEFGPEELTPMYARGHKRFFIEELCELDDGRYVVPHSWIIRKGELTADCSDVLASPAGWSISSDKPHAVKAREFKYTYEDIIARIDGPPSWISETVSPPMLHPMRQLAPDCDVYVVMAPVWADDVSGNRSKQYNKHMNMYAANSNLPGRLLQQEYFVRFVSTSPNATSPEQFAAIRDQINASQTNPIKCYNADTHRNCAVIVRCPALPADNPQQAEEASHIGGNGNCPCRKCKVGGPQAVKQTNDGYHAHHMVGVARSASEIVEEIEKQFECAMTGVAERVTERQRATGTKDKVASHFTAILIDKARALKKQNRSGDEISRELHQWLDEQPGDKMNPLLSISGLDPSQDTPVEILHTVLLGIVKYAWHTLHTSWTDESDRTLFTIRLQSTDIDGLSIAPIRAAYMMQYRNNLIGKDFKTLMQTAPFHVHGNLSKATEKHPNRFPLVRAIGELGAALWVHEIDNMDQYLSDLEILTANVLDAFDEMDCKKILVKIKLHMLPHLIEDVRRFGPAIRNSTEVFECFNAIFRLCSVLSNHQAPSRDIARKFSSLDRIKHILSGEDRPYHYLDTTSAGRGSYSDITQQYRDSIAGWYLIVADVLFWNIAVY